MKGNGEQVGDNPDTACSLEAFPLHRGALISLASTERMSDCFVVIRFGKHSGNSTLSAFLQKSSLKPFIVL